MSYSRPNYDAAYATFAGADPYTRPDYDDAWRTFAAPAADVYAYLAANTPLGAAAVLADVARAGSLSVGTVLQGARLLGNQPPFGMAAAASPLSPSAAALLGLHDFTGAPTDGAPPRYYVYLVTDSGDVRVPATSCQGTVNIGATGYLQAVLPNAGEYIDAINGASAFYVARAATFGGVEVETPIATASVDNVSLAQGPFNYSATVSGATPALPDAGSPPPAAYDRTLQGVRVLFTSSGARRVRCSIDWLLRPGFRAYVFESPMIVRFINFYLTAGGDEFMDCGESV